MGDGWKRGLGAYSGSNPGLTVKPDYRNSQIRRAPAPDGDRGGYASALPRGGAPRHAPKAAGSLKPVSAAAPKGKYARA